MTSWNVLMTVNSAGALGFMNLLLFKQVRWGFFSLSSTILSFPTLKCNLLLVFIEQCSYLNVSLWHNQWNNFNISYTDFTFFLERPLSLLSCDSTFGVYCLVALFYLTEWMEIAAVKGSLVPLPDFFESISALFLFFFKRKFSGHFRRNLLKVFTLEFMTTCAPSVTPLWS